MTDVSVVAAKLNSLRCKCGRQLMHYDATARSHGDDAATVFIACPSCHDRAEINLKVDVEEDIDDEN